MNAATKVISITAIRMIMLSLSVGISFKSILISQEIDNKIY